MSHSTPELRPVPGILPTIRDRWPLVAGVMLAGLLIGYLVAAVAPRHYAATTTVWIGPGLVNIGDVANDNSLVGTEQAAIATLDPQLDRIAATLGDGVTRSDVEGSLSVANRPDTSLLDFTYTGDGRARAERGADVSADVYLARAKDIAEMRLGLQAEQVRASLVDAPLDQRATLQSQLQTLNTTVVTPGAVLKDSAGTSQPSGIPPVLFAPLGALAGLLLGLVAAYLLESRRPRVRPGAPLQIAPVEHLGRIRREDTPAAASSVFLVPDLLTGEDARRTLGLVVLGGDPAPLESFARESIVSSGMADPSDVVWCDLATAEGLRTARSVAGVIVLVRERVSAVEDVESGLRRLQAMGVPVYGVVTAPAVGPDMRIVRADDDPVSTRTLTVPTVEPEREEATAYAAEPSGPRAATTAPARPGVRRPTSRPSTAPTASSPQRSTPTRRPARPASEETDG